MQKNIEPNSGRVRLLWMVGAWLASVVLHFVFYVADIRTHPPTDEIYTQMISFRMAAFGFTRLPYWLGVLALALVFELAKFRRVLGGEVK
jgi:hypothetical protein